MTATQNDSGVPDWEVKHPTRLRDWVQQSDSSAPFSAARHSSGPAPLNQLIHDDSQRRSLVGMGKSPSFQFYPRDFLTDERVQLMSMTERGIYITLLSICWLEGSLPAAPASLARFVQMPITRFQKVWHGPVGQCFSSAGEGRISQKRLEEERRKQTEFRRRQADNGAKGGRPKQNPSLSSGFGLANPLESPRVAESKEQTANRKELTDEDRIFERAGKLREELYPAWYAKYRHGARLRLVANSLEFQDAVSLVRTWDDARLEKLARIVLTTDDPFISTTDRSLKIFAMKASWADDRLRQAERGATS